MEELAVEVSCPLCSGIVEDDGSLSGQVVQCPYCSGQFQMPVPQVTSISSFPAAGASPSSLHGLERYRRAGPTRSPIAAVLFSLLICTGFGQMHNGQTIKGICLLIAHASMWILSVLFVPILLVVVVVIWLYGLFDAYITADRLSRRRCR